MDKIQQLIDIVTQAYPGIEVLIRTNNIGHVRIYNPETQVVASWPPLYFAHIFKPKKCLSPPMSFRDSVEYSYKAYARTMEEALVTAINLRDPQLLTSRGYQP